MSLRAKLTLASLIFTIAVLGIAVWGTYANLKRDLLAVSAKGQENVASKLAEDISAAVRLYHEALGQIAQRVPERDMNSPQALERFLAGFPIGQTLFTRIVIFDPAGLYVSDLPATDGVRGKSFADREYLRDVMRERRPLVSAPLKARILDQPPIVVLSVPVIRGERLAGVVSGYLNLRKAELLGPLLNYRIGENGYAMVVANDGTYLTHPVGQRILTKVGNPEILAAIAQLRAGAEPIVHAHFEDDGKAMTASLRRINALDWVVIAVEPESAVLAPAADTLNRTMAIGAFLLALGVPLFFLAVTRLTRPLATLAAQVRGAGTGAVAGPIDQQITVHSHDEIGTLADALRAAFAALLEKDAKLKRSDELFRELGANIPEFLWVREVESGKLLYVNQAWERIAGHRTETGVNFQDLFSTVHPEDLERVRLSAQSAPLGGFDEVIRFLNPNASTRWVHVRSFPVRDGAGRIYRIVGLGEDITDRWETEERLRASLAEKETLLREIHHRVKNNLQIISSLLHFQSRKVKNPENLAVFQEGRDRLKSMILVHEKLYQSRDLSRIEFGDYARALVEEIGVSYRDSAKHMALKVEAAAVYLPIEVALPLGMLLSELATNVFKYAYPAGNGGELRVTITGAEGQLRLEVADDGAGLPERVDPDAPASFGMQLVANLAAQLGGSVRYARGAGLAVEVSVPLVNAQDGAEERAA